VCSGLGIGPKRINRIAGVAKAYTTRVGEGPMPSEFEAEFAEKVRKEGNEYGATTGRPRRCGWFDAPAVRRSILVAGIEEIMLTKLDVLDPLEKVRIGTRYRIDGKEMEVFPTDLAPETPVEVVYEELPGWKTPTSACKTYEELPANARRYIERIEKVLGLPVSVVSVSADRSGTIVRTPGFF
jgi:adenylosuccinate synthase